MTWILRVLIFIFAAFLANSSPAIYEAKENDNITIEWDCQIKTDMTHTNMIFHLLSDPPKVLYEMLGGKDIIERPHQQFAGRVQCDKDALREGRIRLHLSRVIAQDSGNYSFDLSANYDRTLKKWVLEMSELFVLNISHISDGVNTDLCGSTPGQANPADAKDQSRETDAHWLIAGLTLAAIFAFIVFSAVCCLVKAQRCNIFPRII